MTATLPPRLHELYGEEQTPAPTTHHRLRAWVEEVARLTAPADVHWCDGSEADRQRLIATLLASGTLSALNPRLRPDSYCARTDPDDVARVEDRTFICSRRAADAGPTNHWADPTQMITTMTALYRGSMRGRTMYVVPFCMGRVDAEQPMFGVELTDSPYVALSMMIMTRVGHGVLAAMTAGVDAEFVRCLHSVGAPLRPDAVDVPWPCNPTKYISHFPEERMIWSYGSGYGGNSLLGKKCYALRIASAIGRDEGWLAEHMLILKITGPSGRSHHLAAAFPSACGKTNLAMIEPTLPGWQVETLGDDIAWLRVGADGRLWATNPEYGFFGVAPGTGWATNPNAMRTLAAGHTIFTNVALTDDGDVWWEGLTPEPPAHLTDWQGESWTPADGRPAAHPNSRFCTPISQCPVLAPSFDDPDGVPLDAIVFGGRRPSTVPLVAQAHDWPHGVFLGATLSSETTAAAAGRVGVVRRDPMAMLPFLGYHVADYFAHWLGLGRHHDAARLPQIFHVNWFRRTPDGAFAWPGYGENARVLKWIVERLEGEVDAVDTPLGLVPAPGGIDVTGLTQPYDLDAALAVRREEVQAELPLIEDWFATVGPTLPRGLRDELDLLKIRLLS